MYRSEECKSCKPPEACLISCPNNKILDRMRLPDCVEIPDGLGDLDTEIEVVLSPNSAEDK